MGPDVTLLVLTAASIGFVHTVLGPDHYLPFVALAKARAWSARRTAWITGLCSGAHVMSSVLIGAIGIAAGAAVERVLHIENFRGHVAPWLLLGFGLAYAAWGVKRALRGGAHRHEHFHADGTRHSHDHDHRLAPHLHPHMGDSSRRGLSPVLAAAPEGDSPLRGQSPGFTIQQVAPVGKKPLPSITPWALFIVFAFGPCESLIPLLMYPAAEANWLAVAAVCAAFGATTLATMLAIVLLLRRGLEAFDWSGLERWTHAIAGGAIAICAAAILALGHTHAHAEAPGHGHPHSHATAMARLPGLVTSTRRATVRRPCCRRPGTCPEPGRKELLRPRRRARTTITTTTTITVTRTTWITATRTDARASSISTLEGGRPTMKLIRHKRSREAERWLKQEVREQKVRYRKIVAEQDALAPKREKWIAAFLDRIQTRGFNVHADMLRKIPAEEIPQKPRRKFKVVF
jgi:nickel/cobalt transporter (NicO) family protein